MRNFVVSNLRSGKSKYALDVQGFKDAPIYDLRLADCSFSNVAEPDIIKNVKGLAFQNVRINGKLVESEVGSVGSQCGCGAGSSQDKRNSLVVLFRELLNRLSAWHGVCRFSSHQLVKPLISDLFGYWFYWTSRTFSE